jgi:hypothetical protein
MQESEKKQAEEKLERSPGVTDRKPPTTEDSLKKKDDKKSDEQTKSNSSVDKD